MAESLVRAQEISGKKIHFYACDLLDKNCLSEVFRKVVEILIDVQFQKIIAWDSK